VKDLKNPRNNEVPKPLLGVSQCLLGDAVRYDGQSKANQIILKQLAPLFQLVPVCPEVEAGLSIPRPAVQLTGSIENPRLIGRDDVSLDVTNTLSKYQKPLAKLWLKQQPCFYRWEMRHRK